MSTRQTMKYKGFWILTMFLSAVLSVFSPIQASAAVTLISDDAGLVDPLYITTDGIKLYVTDGNHKIHSIPIGGGTLTSIYTAFNPMGITVIGNDLFWIDPNSGPYTDTQIWKALKDGTGTTSPIYTESAIPNVQDNDVVDGSGLCTDGTRLYAADEVQGRVVAMNPDGSGRSRLDPGRYSGFFDTEHLNTITESGGVLYIADGGKSGVTAPQVVSIPTSGGTFTTLASGTPFVSPTDITVGNGTIYIADAGANTIWQMPLSGGTPTALVSGAPFVQVWGLTFYNNALYVVDRGGSAIYKIDFGPSEVSPSDDIALNSSGSGYPTPVESDSGWGGGSYPWEIVDGKRTYEGEWAHGLAFTGGTSNWAGQTCGWRQATIDFGQPKTFNKVVVWHHGLDHVPTTYKIQYWDGTNWLDVFSTINGHAYLKYPTSQPTNWWESWSTPTENTFAPVTSTKVRFALNNCDITHGWIYEFEVYNDAVSVQQWAYTYGGTNHDFAYSIQQTKDGGYIAAGVTVSFGLGIVDLWILKLNNDGTIAWQKTYGGADYEGDIPYNSGFYIQQTSDGGYIVAGGTKSFGAGNYDFWVLKLNGDGTIAWQNTYGGTGYDYATSIQQTSDGGYIVAGVTQSFPDTGPWKIWVLKLNNDGTISWQKIYEVLYTGCYFPQIHQTSDGGYILAGTAAGSIWILKLNSDGTVAWEKLYKEGDVSAVNSIQQTTDGGYIVSGWVNYIYYPNPRWDGFWVLKLNSDGTIAWQKTYGEVQTDDEGYGYFEGAYSIRQTADGGYVVAGYKSSKTYCADIKGVREDIWILKLNSDGTVAWEKTYGGNCGEEAYSIQQTSDGGYILAGNTDSFGAGGADVLILKLDSNGEVPGCQAMGTSSAIVFDTNAGVPNISTAVADTDVSPVITSATITDTNAEVSQVCYYSPEYPDITVFPTSKDFGNVNVGSSSAPETFTITNNGTANLIIASVSITGANASEFRKQGDNCSGQTIAPSSNCTVQVVFSPNSASSKTADLSIQSNDPDTPSLSLPLSGIGIRTVPGDCNADGQTTINEVQGAVNQYLGVSAAQSCNDLNGDGQVTIDEVQKVINAFLGLGGACTYSISPTSQSFDSTGGNGTVNVTAPSGCSWTAVSNDSWITINSGSSGSGNGTVNYAVSANTNTSQRTGTMAIAGQIFTVTQGPACIYSISPTSQSFDSTGGNGTVNVTAPGGCSWTATSNDPDWITITSGSSGTGNGTVTYTVAANTSPSERTGTMTIAEQTFSVTQSAPPTGLTISSLSTSSAVPFSLLTIMGSGFDPVNSAISVLFTPDGSGVPIAVPAISASADSLEVIVPPFLDQTPGFSSGVMSVQAIQVSGSTLMTSNTIGGLNVGALPSIPSSDPPGAVTKAYINAGLIFLNDIQTFAGTSPSYADLLSVANALSADLISTVQAIDSIIQNPTQTITLPTVNGEPFVLDAATLAVSDPLVLAIMQQYLAQVQSLPSASRESVGAPGIAQAPVCGEGLDPISQAVACGYQQNAPPVLQCAGAAMQRLAETTYGHVLLFPAIGLVVTGLIAGGTVGAVVAVPGALWIGWEAGSTLNALYSALGCIKTPTAATLPAAVNQVSLGTVGVPPGVVDGAMLTATANSLSSAPIGPDPQGGLVLSYPTTPSTPSSNPIVYFPISGQPQGLMAPNSQVTVPANSVSFPIPTTCTPKCDDCYSAYDACTPPCDSLTNLFDRAECINACLSEWKNCLNICEY